MYTHIYFDLDDTLVRDNPVTNKSEILESGLERYKELKSMYPNTPISLLTNRYDSVIKYPDVYTFNSVIGRDTMKEYIKENRVTIKDLLSLRNIYIYLIGISLFKSKHTPKVYYLFLRHTVKNERVLVIDDDIRVSRLFK
jgi:hypothetical protein